MKQRNLVAKYAHQFNRAKVHTPKSNTKDQRRGIYDDVDFFMDESKEPHSSTETNNNENA